MLTRLSLLQIFPQGEVTQFDTLRGRFEVSGLGRNTQPQNCRILATGGEQQGADRRDYYIVEAQQHTLRFRICTAMAGCGYDEFSCGEFVPSASAEVRMELWMEYPSNMTRHA